MARVLSPVKLLTVFFKPHQAPIYKNISEIPNPIFSWIFWDFGGPGGGPLDPDRKMMQIPGGFASIALTATPFRPRHIFCNICYFWKNRFSTKSCFYLSKTTNRHYQNDRRMREKFSCFHKKLGFRMVFTSQTRISYGRPTLSIFFIINSFHHVYMFHRNQTQFPI